MSRVRLKAADGCELAGELFVGAVPVAAVVIAPAMGVPQRLYAGFASYLAEQGFAALTLDYRGTGHSRPAALRGFAAAMHDWGELDLPAALDELSTRYPALPLGWIGHSAGAQLFGLLPASRVRAALFIAGQSGHWRHWSGPRRWFMFSLWHLLIPGVTAVVGYLPMKGESVPAGVAREWARWGRDPDYVWSYARERGGLQFTRYAGPLRAVAIADDSYAPRRAVEGLVQHFTATRPEIVDVSPREVGASAIGHFGFFRSAFRQTLWADCASWLKRELAPA